MRRMADTSARITLLRKLALACAVLVLAITSLSAYIRLSRAGLGCEPWPQCYEARAGMSAQALAPLDHRGVVTARVAHRITASAALLVVIALLMKSLAVQPMLWRQGRLALAVLALALFLAVLGRIGGDSRIVPVVLGNLLGGLTMFALACRLVQATVLPGSTRIAWLRPWIAAALVLLSLQLALGGLASSQHAASTCATAGLCALHRTVGIATAAVLVTVGALAARAGMRLGAAVIVLALAQVALGTLVVTSAAPLAFALAHNLLAALLLAALLALLPPR
jgi:heme a synthase